jgi:hypothetical protein
MLLFMLVFGKQALVWFFRLTGSISKSQDMFVLSFPEKELMFIT